MTNNLVNLCIGHFLKEAWLPRCKMCRVNEDNLKCYYYKPTKAEIIGTMQCNPEVSIYREVKE